MAKRMLIDATHPEETRVVVLSGHRLEEFDYETSTKKQIKGNIYLAKVTRVEPSLQAAFVEYGGNRHGFLAFNEIHPDYYRIPMSDRAAFEPADESPTERRAWQSETENRDEGQASPEPEGGADRSDDHDSSEEQPNAGERASDEGHVSPVYRAAQSHDVIYESLTPATESEVDVVTSIAPPNREEESQGDAAAPDEDANSGQPWPDERDAERSAEIFSAGAGALESVAESGQNAEFDQSFAAPIGDSPTAGESDRPEAHAIETLGGDEIDEGPRQRFRPHRHYKIQEVVKRRQIMLVQVTKEERGNKGAALTTYISLAGRYCVLMPNTPRGGGVSRKITSMTDRRRLKELVGDLEVPEGMGVIVRTAGSERSKTEIKRDFEYLIRLWDEIRNLTLKSTAPALIYEEGNLIKRSIRDLYSRDIDEVVIDGEEGYRTAKDFMKMLMPSHAKRVKLYRDPSVPLFHRHQVEGQLDAIHSPVVQLRSGGYIVINPTEALVAIDVNSGRSTRERNIEETALKTNVEAAEEIARQLRLRDLAGLIVIDFIDMEEGRNIVTVERRLKEAMRHDRARIQIGRISPFGLMELSRQRLRPSLIEASTEPCPHCGGTGHVRSIESTALHILRAIEEEGMLRRSAEISVAVPTGVALYLLNQKRAALVHTEARYRLRVALGRDDTLIPPAFRMERLRAFTPEEIAALPILTAPVIEEEEEEETRFEDEDGEPSAAAEERTEEDSGDRLPERGRGRRRRRRGGSEKTFHSNDAADFAPPLQPETGDGDATTLDHPIDRGDASERSPIPSSNGALEAGLATGAANQNEATTDAPPGEFGRGPDSDGSPKRRRRGRRGGRRRRRDLPGDSASPREDGGETSPTDDAPSKADTVVELAATWNDGPARADEIGNAQSSAPPEPALAKQPHQEPPHRQEPSFPETATAESPDQETALPSGEHPLPPEVERKQLGDIAELAPAGPSTTEEPTRPAKTRHGWWRRG
jgi:ribonuclease E